MNDEVERLATLTDTGLPRPEVAAGDPALVELLQTAAAVATLADVPAPPKGLRSGRAAFIAAGVARARPAPEPIWQRWLPIPRDMGSRRLGIALAGIVLALGLALGAASTAAADSLPGDPLYAVKRAEEGVLMLLTPPDARTTLLERLDSRRRAEVSRLVAGGREADVEFTCSVGSVVSTSPLRFACSEEVGLVVDAAGADVTGLPAEGVPAQVSGRTASGEVLAFAVGFLEAGNPSIELRPVVKAVPSQTEARAAEAEPLSPGLPAAPLIAGAGQAQGATDGAVQVAVEPGTPADAVESTGSEPIEFPTEGEAAAQAPVTQTDPAAPAPASAVPAASAIPTALSLSGTIEEIGSVSWRIDGRSVEVTSQTLIEGLAQAGLTAEVDALLYPDGRTVAQRIAVSAPVPDTTFAGVLESHDPDVWRVNRQRVRLDATTRIEGRPRVGAWVEVAARRLPDGELLAVTLEVR